MCFLLTLLFEFQENKSDLETLKMKKMHSSNSVCIIGKVSFVCLFLLGKKKKRKEKCLRFGSGKIGRSGWHSWLRAEQKPQSFWILKCFCEEDYFKDVNWPPRK